MDIAGQTVGEFVDLPAGVSRAMAQRRVGQALAAAGMTEAAYEARVLVSAAAGVDHLALVAEPDMALAAPALERLRAMLARRLEREPLSRILGWRGFWSLDLAVAPGVLDPRSDSETLITAAVDRFAPRQTEALRLLDLGTGSGALLCALLAEFPAATGIGIDNSPAACRLAAENLSRCGFAERAIILKQDWRDGLAGLFDLIVSNPPYIATAAIAGLDRDVREHDPVGALDGGHDGLDAYRTLAPVLARLLMPDGAAIIEIGAGQAVEVATLMQSSGLKMGAIRRDFGGHERALVLLR